MTRSRGFDPDQGFDGGLSRRLRWRKLRRKALFLVAAVCFVEFAGLPCVRMQPDGRSAYYIGVTGVHAPQGRGALPLIVLRPLDRSLWRIALDAARGWKEA